MVDVEFLCNLHGKLHNRANLLSMWQELADNFYPERADFTTTLTLGTDYAAHLMTSYPIMMRRDFANSLGAMLRPESMEWMHPKKVGGPDDDEDTQANAWLSDAGEKQRKLMYDSIAGLSRATKACDNDYVTFGQGVMQVHWDWARGGLCFQSWHLRDVAWSCDQYGQIDVVSRKWNPSVREMAQMFGEDKLTPDQRQMLTKDPFSTVECAHFMIPGKMAGKYFERFPFVSIYISTKDKTVLEAVGSYTRQYVIPRWELVGGSQYAISPAAMIALPDARQMQTLARIVIEAGEKAVDPPIIASRNIGREGWNLYAGGMTYHDIDPGENIRDQMMLATNDKSGLPIGLEMQQDLRQMMRSLFYLDRLTMPQAGPDKTAYEVSLIHQDHLRQALPLFAPIEADYNGQLCEEVFAILMRVGEFGSLMDMPESLRGAQVRFEFRNPLHDAVEKIKAQKFIELKGVFAEAVAMDQNVQYDIDIRKAARQAMAPIADPEWMRSMEEADQFAARAQEARQAQELLAMMQQGANVAKTVAESGVA